MKPLRVLVVLAVLLGAAPSALAASRAAPTPQPLPSPLSIQHDVIHLQSAQGCGTVYSCTQNALGQYYPAGAGVEVADDLHMVGFGHLCGVDLGYYKSTPGTTGAAIAFYANDPTDSVQPMALLAGPYVLTDLPSGSHVLHLDLEPGTGSPDLTQDIWLGVSFSTDETGLFVAGPPELGSSHNLFYMTPPGEANQFCEGAPANFYLVVRVNESTVPVGTTTWGRLKQLYR
jgi:hypothetical protein